MSRALFNVLHTYKEEWFGTNPVLDLLQHYSVERDGFSLMKELLTDTHPNLRRIGKSETMDKPQISDYETWFSYMSQYRKWVDFEKRSAAKREYTPEEHVANILKQISDIDVFKIAKEKVEEKMVKYDEDLIEFPDELHLHRIGLTIYNYIPQEHRHALPSFIAPTTATIHRLNQPNRPVRNPYNPQNRSQQRNPRNNKETNANQSRDDISFKPANLIEPGSRAFEDVTCSACGQAGHDIHLNGCDATAMQTKIDDWKRKIGRNFDKKTVLELYDEHQENKRKKRMMAWS